MDVIIVAIRDIDIGIARIVQVLERMFQNLPDCDRTDRSMGDVKFYLLDKY